jgi:HrpA-like RNA helicase
MPGEGMINETYEEIAKMGFIDMTNVRKLYGKMSQAEQAEAIANHPDKPRITIATNVAETGLTISNADVISSGLVNSKWLDSNTGLEYLTEVKHTKSGIIQQKGRAGRTGPGSFRYLGSEAEFNGLKEYKDPEVTTQDLTQEALLLDNLGISLDNLPMVDKPNPYNWERAQRNLFIIGAIDARTRKLTAVGKEMAKISVEPHFARAIVVAKRLGCPEPVISAAALAQTESAFIRGENDQQKEQIAQAKKSFFSRWPGSDFLANLDIVRQYQKQPPAYRETWAKSHYLRPQALEAALEDRSKLLRALNIKDQIQEIGPYDGKTARLVERSFVAGFCDKLMVRNSYNNLYTLVLDQSVNNLAVDKDSAANRTQLDNILVMVRNYSRSYRQKEINAQVCQRAAVAWLPRIYQKAFAKR